MGANAVTTVPVYTAGEVLTAADMNITNSGIPVFATTVTRDAAFGGAGEKTLAEGQFAYIEATNTTQYYDGAAWQPVGTTPGLVCVKAETAFTTASTVEIDNAFSSSYTNYKMFVRYQNTTAADIFLRMRVGGVSASGSNYNAQTVTGSSTSALAYREVSQTSGYVAAASNGAFWSSAEISIFSPYVAEPTVISSINNRSAGAYTAPVSNLFVANHTLSTSYDGVQILLSGGTITGTYTVYGYGKTV
jgi:hypothetical protein